MKLTILYSICLVFSAAASSAGPISGTLIGDISKDILNYECRELSGTQERVTCDFVQVLLSKKSKPTDLAEKLAGFLKQIETESVASVVNEFCPMSASLDAVINGNHDATLETMDRIDLIEAIDAYQASPPKAREDMDRFAANARDVCNNPSDETLEKMFTSMHERETRSCQVFVNKYTQTYVKISDTLWAVESTPSGVCGAVNTSKFIGHEDYGFLWEHETSKIIMNKEGEGLVKCADLDESKTFYTWKNGLNFLGCDYIN